MRLVWPAEAACRVKCIVSVTTVHCCMTNLGPPSATDAPAQALLSPTSSTAILQQSQHLGFHGHFARAKAPERTDCPPDAQPGIMSRLHVQT